MVDVWALPTWLLAGLALGLLASLVAAGAFALGARLFPARRDRDRDRVDGTARRRAQIRDYLRAIDEDFLEDHAIGDATVAFYLPGRGVAITFDPKAYFDLAGAEVTPVLCEHELPPRTLGRRLPFEVPAVGPGAAGERGVREAFDDLGLATDADPAAVTRAYRERVVEVHPDQDGTREEFRSLQAAYATALEHAEE